MAQPAPIPLGPRTPAKPPPTFSYLLADSIQRASSRTAASKLIYEPIAALWDEYLASDAVRKLPARLRHPMNSLCKDFILTAQRHFDSYLTGTPCKPLSHTNVRESNSPAPATPALPATTDLAPTSNAPSNLSLSNSSKAPGPVNIYADTVNSFTEDNTPAIAPTDRNAARKPKPTTKRPDNRLFVRIAPNHPTRSAGLYLILAALKRTLQEDAYLLKEVQETATGFALCTKSANTLAQLETHTTVLTQVITN